MNRVAACMLVSVSLCGALVSGKALATTTLSPGDAAIMAANMRAMGEACGLTAAEQATLRSVTAGQPPVPEAAIDKEMAAARDRAKAQQAAPEFKEKCDFLRFRIANGA